MKFKIKDEEFLEEVEKLPQLDRIEFRQKRIHFTNLYNNTFMYSGLFIVLMFIFMGFITLGVILGVGFGYIDLIDMFAMLIGTIGATVCMIIYVVINRDKKADNTMKDQDEWTNKYFKFTKR